MTFARSGTASGVWKMGRVLAFRTILGTLLASALVLAISCSSAGEPTAPTPTSRPVSSISVPPTSPPPSHTATASAPDPTVEPATRDGALSRLSGLGDRLAAELPEGLPADIPRGLDISEGWLQVDLATPERAAVIQELNWWPTACPRTRWPWWTGWSGLPSTTGSCSTG